MCGCLVLRICFPEYSTYDFSPSRFNCFSILLFYGFEITCDFYSRLRGRYLVNVLCMRCPFPKFLVVSLYVCNIATQKQEELWWEIKLFRFLFFNHVKTSASVLAFLSSLGNSIFSCLFCVICFYINWSARTINTITSRFLIMLELFKIFYNTFFLPCMFDDRMLLCPVFLLFFSSCFILFGLISEWFHKDAFK